MRNQYSKEEMENLWASVEIAFGEHGLRCEDGHWMTDKEFAALSENEIITLFELIYVKR